VEVGIYRRVYQRRSKINGEEGRERLKKKKKNNIFGRNKLIYQN